MFNSHQLITDEEMYFLLDTKPSSSARDTFRRWSELPYLGGALCLFKGIFLMALLMSPEAKNWPISSSYLWLRGGVELVLLAVFWMSASSPRYRNVAYASLLMTSTSLLMDVLAWVAMIAS